jgi:hypothetical protein
MAAELTVSAFDDHGGHNAVSDASCVVVASAVDTKKEKLLIVAGVWRKDLEMSSIAVRAVWQIQRLTDTRGNLHLALAEILNSP